MPLTGGEADKVGNGYETLWTVRCMLRILAEDARSIVLEPLGEEGDGAEFILTGDKGAREFHQVKRQRTGGWNISTLASAGVLGHFQSHLDRDAGVVCVFVSQDEPQNLRELWERAKRAPTPSDFERYYISSAEQSANFADLQRHWGNRPLEEIYGLLRRISIEGGSETTLRQEVLYRSGTLVEGKAENVLASLWQLATISIRQTLDATAIWDYLEDPKRGYRRRAWKSDPSLLPSIQVINDNYLAPVRSLNILDVPIPRMEAKQVFGILQGEHHRRSVLITGEAGSGKTGVVAEIIQHAEAQGWLTLAIRLDRLDTTALSSKQVGVQLDLTDSPVTVLGEVAGDRPSLLLIDQLDAVSATSGRNPAFFERVEELVRESASYSGMRLVLSCRKFDLQNDERLRRLIDQETGIAQEVAVDLLDAETVRSLVLKSGVDPALLSAGQLTFLATPLHLKLFTEVKAPLTFETLKDLYDAYWNAKWSAVRERLQRPPVWIPLFDSILQKMVSEQTLSVPQSMVADAYPEELKALLTEQVLSQDGKRLSFFHETFFDYVFARRFVAEGKRLVGFLRAQEQHLFLRGIVRQVLTHERSEDFPLYLSDLQDLLESPDIRFHLKRLVFQWLRSLARPTSQEWTIVQSLRDAPDPDVARWSESVINSPAWFSLLTELGWIGGELECRDETRVERAVNYLGGSVRDAPFQVVETLLAWADQPEPWPTYATNILSHSDVDTSRRFIDLYIKLQQKGNIPLAHPPFGSNSGQYFLYDLPEKQPGWAIELLEEWLIRYVNQRDRQGHLDPFIETESPYGRHLDGIDDRMHLMVTNAPHEFVERLLPIVLELIRRNAVREGESPWRDKIWLYHFYNSQHNFHEQLIKELVEGLRYLAVHDPDVFLCHADALSEYLDFETAGWILTRAFAADGKRYAEAGVALLLRSPAWLGLGWTDSSDWVSRELIKSISPYCSPVLFERLEDAVLNYYSSWERENPRHLGWAQLTLLNGFPKERRSDATRRRLRELQRKFNMEDGNSPQGIRSGVVGAPIAANWDLMTDAQWLRAIRKHNTERSRASHFLQGGASELSHVLQQQTEKDPVRYLRLLLQLPDETNTTYFEQILWGIGKAPTTDPELLWSAIRRCHALPNRPCGRSISSALNRYGENAVPHDILEIIAWYATEDPDPAKETWKPRGDDETIYYGGDAASAGLNSVRGGMAWPVAELLFDHKEYFEFFEPYLERMVTDPSIAVRTQVAHTLLPVLNIDREMAVTLFLRLIDPFHAAYAHAHFVIDFLRYAVWTHFSAILPFIEQMLADADPKTVQTGAQFACLAALIHPEASQLGADCLAGSVNMRRGAAKIAAERLFIPSDRAWCEAALIQLFDDEDQETRRAAANCFREVAGEKLVGFTSLIDKFIESAAFGEDSRSFFHTLETATVPLPDIICSVFEKSVTLTKGLSAGEAIRSGRFADRNSQLLVRLYERTLEPAIKTRCLNVIDALARTDAAYDMDRTLAVRDMQ
ncbi:MAG: hypothetical protein V4671_07890 [Armatimonadota bacterium]